MSNTRQERSDNVEPFDPTTVYYFDGVGIEAKTFPTKQEADEFIRKLPNKRAPVTGLGGRDGMAQR